LFSKKFFSYLIILCIITCFSTASLALDSDSCKKVRFSDVGWTDISSTTALTSILLKGLGYNPKLFLLSVPVSFTSLKNDDIDVFLGLWMPSMAADIKPYFKDGSIEKIRTNLVGAKYTLAVPKYVWEAGVKELM